MRGDRPYRDLHLAVSAGDRGGASGAGRIIQRERTGRRSPGRLCLTLAVSLGVLNGSARVAAALAPPAGQPLGFEANHGQAGPEAQFVSRTRSGTFLLGPAEASVILAATSPEPSRLGERASGRRRNRPVAARTLSLRFAGADPEAAMTGEGRLPGKANYLLGREPSEWRTDLPLFQKIRVTALYPGIDLVYYGNQQKLEYDLVVAPGAEVSAVCLRVVGADRIELDAQGDLVLSVGRAQLRQHKPMIHQVIGGVRREITGGYRLRDAQTVAIEVGQYDPQWPLTIDPVLSYSTYFGGSSTDAGYDIAVDSAGNVYIAGETLSPLLPTTPGALQTNYAGGYPGAGGDAFIAKFDHACSNLIYLTYLGGKGNDGVLALALDATNNVYLTGFTDSTDFPVTNAIRSELTGTPSLVFGLRPVDAFVTKLNASGSALMYSTYLGGDTYDEGIGLVVDSTGSVYLTGFTDSTNFPAVNPLQTNLAGSADAFVTKLGSPGTNFVFSTRLGGTNWDQGNGIAVDAAGRVFVAGLTSSTNFPTTNAIQPWLAGGQDAFVAVIATNGANLLRSTYLGGAGDDYAQRIRLDAAGNAGITGPDNSLANWQGSFPFTPTQLNPGGVFTSTDAGASWSRSTAGLLHPRVFSLALDPSAASRIYAGTGRGVAISTDGGASWNTSIRVPPTADNLASPIAVGAVFALAASASTPSTVYAGTAAGVYRSLDAGTNWSLSSTGLVSAYPGSVVYALAFDPADSATLYAGTEYGVYRTSNSASNWVVFNSGMGSLPVRALAFDPISPATLYAATYGYGIYRSLNRGTNWAVFNSGLTNRYCQSLAIDPQVSSTLYAGTDGGLFKTTNRGTNWNILPLSLAYTNGLPVPAIALDPSVSTTVYAGTSNGLFWSADGGLNWSVFTNGIARERIQCLSARTGTPVQVYAGSAADFFVSEGFLTKLDGNTGDIVLSTVWGGTGLAFDSLGNSYLVGSTTLTNLPIEGAGESLSTTNSGNNDVFVAVLNPDASALLYSVYLGGAGGDFGYNVAVDPAGNAYIVGQTWSTDFPTNAAFQPVSGGGGDAFIAKIEPRPLLGVALAGGSVQLKWPASSSARYALETVPTLPAGSWTAVPETPVLLNGWYTVTLPASGSSGFFRLRRP